MIRSSSYLIDIIRYFEGFSAVPYMCAGGYNTIGYGHVIKASEKFDAPINKEQATSLLEKDVQCSEKAVCEFIHTRLEIYQSDALISFTYNLGAGALQRSTLRRKINRGEYRLAAGEFSRWVYAGGKKLNGLVKRRYVESQLFQGNYVILGEQ